MSPLELVLVLFAVLSTASPIFPRQTQNFTFEGDAPYSVNASTLAAALTCPNGYPTSSSPPVLLVHGTACTGNATWGQGYVPALLADGYTACYVTLPNRAMSDMQVSSEYVAYNLHYISYLSGGLQTAVVAHSQGNPDVEWALQFWPSTRNVTRAFVALSPDFQGIHIAETSLAAVCDDGLCQPSLWQQANGSNYYNALHGSDFTELVPTTVVWSESDGIVLPPEENAQLPGATIISVQELCPLRVVIHFEMPIDAAGYSIALDALENDGTASLASVKKSELETCLSIVAPHMSVTVEAQITADWDDLVDGFM